MVSATDYSNKPGALPGDTSLSRPKRRRFRLFATLAAPFRDIDDRAVKKRTNGAVRNNSKGNLFAKSVAESGALPVKRFPRNGE
jgi:hypothetical protein